jgi:hypothetical protein
MPEYAPEGAGNAFAQSRVRGEDLKQGFLDRRVSENMLIAVQRECGDLSNT